MSPRMPAILLREAAVEPKGRPRCTFTPYSYTHVELYKHFPAKMLEKGDILISGIGGCDDDNEACNALRERLASLTREERHELLAMANQVDGMLQGTTTRDEAGNVVILFKERRKFGIK